MFGDVWIELEPNPGGGVEFAEKVVGGSVPEGLLRRASRRASARRPPRACSRAIPLIDFKATLYDGSFHPVDSNELSFKIAASMALKDGVQQAKPVLLEPIMAVEIRVPEQYMGEVNRDLNGRRGRVLGMDSTNGHAGHHRPRAAGGAVHVRDGAALADRRPRHVLARPSTTTRTCRRHIAEKVIEAHRKDVEAAGGHGSRTTGLAASARSAGQRAVPSAIAAARSRVVPS